MMKYFNYAGLGRERPEVRAETRLIQQEFDKYLFSEAGVQWYAAQLNKARKDVLRILGLTTDTLARNILFVPNATTAFQLILSYINLDPGDVVLISDHEHPGIVRSFYRLRDMGINIKLIEANSDDEFCEKLQQFATTNNVRLLALSHVAYTDGRIFPLSQVCQVAKDHNILVAVDGAQAVGHIPVNLEPLPLDFYFFSGHKWCGGPMGTGAFYISDSYMNRNPQMRLDVLDSGSPERYFDLGTQSVGLVSGLGISVTFPVSSRTSSIPEASPNPPVS